MPRSCSICDDNRRAEIEFQVLVGAGVPSVARNFGVGRESLRRHLTNHLPDVISKSAEFRAQYADHLTQRLSQHEKALRELVRVAVSGQNAIAAVGALRDLTRMYRAMHRVARQINDFEGMKTDRGESPQAAV